MLHHICFARKHVCFDVLRSKLKSLMRFNNNIVYILAEVPSAQLFTEKYDGGDRASCFESRVRL